MEKRDQCNTNIYSLNTYISKSPLVKVYNVKFKTLVNNQFKRYTHSNIRHNQNYE